MRRSISWAVATLALCSTAALAAPLRFSVPGHDGVVDEFFRDGPIAAHVVLRAGSAPRIVIAMPAGNSGAALWFESGPGFAWHRPVELRATTRRLPDGSLLQGVEAVVTGSGAPLTLRRALSGSIRVIRDVDDGSAVPSGMAFDVEGAARTQAWQRRRIDGAPGYFLSVDREDGEGGVVRLRVTALTGDAPLTPLPADRLLAPGAAADSLLRDMLAFLSYEEKLLAGSWRFNTYFGRDTLMSLRLLAPVLAPAVTETGLRSVLQRLGAGGEVAHEEDIGEFAALRRLRSGEPASAEPIFDYRMIDDDFLLAPVAAHYLLDTANGRARAKEFLASDADAGASCGIALVRNLRFVVSQARPFAAGPEWRNLLSLKTGESAGNWRDSDDGLGGGRFPYDVNGILVPAALEAAVRLQASGLLEPYLGKEGADGLRPAAAMAATWRDAAPRLFDLRIAPGEARAKVSAYAGGLGIDAAPALAALGADELVFRAVSLDVGGRPVPVLHSDEALALLFQHPAPAELVRIATTLGAPFPAGLMTDVGLVVANPAYAQAALHGTFDRNHYHGAVIWSWQHAMFRAGLERQLARDDLPGPARAVLVRVLDRLREAVDATRAVRGAELWSWSWSDGRYAVEPFGGRQEHETESNAAQLWSVASGL